MISCILTSAQVVPKGTKIEMGNEVRIIPSNFIPRCKLDKTSKFSALQSSQLRSSTNRKALNRATRKSCICSIQEIPDFKVGDVNENLQAFLHGPDYSMVTRNLALELVRVTEAAALRAGKWLGMGDKEAADQAAVDAMRKVLSCIPMDGVVVIGEGEKDSAPMLFNGEVIGDGTPPLVEIAVDPLDGTTLTAQGRNGAISVIALAERGALFNPGPCVYMEKIAVGPRLAGHVSLDMTVYENIMSASRVLGKDPRDISIVVLDRPRHHDLIKEIRQAGARAMLISDGDVEAAISCADDESGLDMLMGIGGTPEGVIAACALKCMGGEMIGRLYPRSLSERKQAEKLGYDVDKILNTDDLVSCEEIFFAATGVSNGALLKGVQYNSQGAITHSIVMRNKSGTIRKVETHHKWNKPGLTNMNDIHL
mmetsp:Transcript_23203/g.32109  ORF Transcript_23203/g.32109 Transcript_23203/m.32109 type:complete len:424 (-) Transcript_23203:212-1483(-)